ncbi:penicillin-binding protein activator LpoB [Rhodoferax sp.]|uniref:penicillin-binding protein activator LpoB n=1 Tax=Rhodoferax sp. TaxID=50421 RepID=UPI0025FFC91E|nr:penicillin-binding protein activator LpoB [Rhodoferax sp.]
MRFHLLLSTAALALAGCASTIESNTGRGSLDANASWAVLPLTNNTDTPQAALSAESLLEHLLRKRGVSGLKMYPATLSRDSLFEPSERKLSEEATVWARGSGVRYAVSGSVEEWRYKVGLDGEPAVGITLKITDLVTEQVVWSSAAASSGWSRQALSGVAQAVMRDALTSLPLPAAVPAK